MIWRSTILGQVVRHCAGILNHPNAGDRSIYETGIAAHDVLHQVGLLTNKKGRTLGQAETKGVADATCAALISQGRSFEGKAEPPLNAERVFAGRDLALNYLWLEPLSPGAEYELRLMADKGWQSPDPAYPDPRPRWVGILDVWRRETIPGEEWEEDTLTVRDYKTNWSAGAAWLDSLQARLYACLALAHCGESTPEVIALEVVNLRTCRTYRRELRFPGALDDVEGWRRDLELAADSIQKGAKGGSHPYSPGAGCLGCPAVGECPAVAALDSPAIDDPEIGAAAYIAAQALSKHLAPKLKQWADEAPIVVPGGSVGFQAVERRQVAESAYSALADEWTERRGDLRGFLVASGLGVTQVESLAKVLHPDDMDTRREWLGRHLETVKGSRFQIRRDDE